MILYALITAALMFTLSVSAQDIDTKDTNVIVQYIQTNTKENKDDQNTLSAAELYKILNHEYYIGQIKPLSGSARAMLAKVAKKADTIDGLRPIYDGILRRLEQHYKKDNLKNQENRQSARQQLVVTLADMVMRKEITEDERNNVLQKMNEFEELSPMQAAWQESEDQRWLAGYQLADIAAEHHYQNKDANMLMQKTYADMHNAQKDSQEHVFAGATTNRTLARALHEIIKTSAGITPWIELLPQSVKNRIGKLNLKKQNNLNRGTGAASLLLQALDLAHNHATRRDRDLTPEEMRALAYFNRRNGVPEEIAEYAKWQKRRSDAQAAVTGTAAIAVPFMMTGDDASKYALTAINSAAIFDSLIRIYGRYKLNKLIQNIKRLSPMMQQDLIDNPPSEKELSEDAQAASGSHSMLDEMGGDMLIDPSMF